MLRRSAKRRKLSAEERGVRILLSSRDQSPVVGLPGLDVSDFNANRPEIPRHKGQMPPEGTSWKCSQCGLFTRPWRLYASQTPVESENWTCRRCWETNPNAVPDDVLNGLFSSTHSYKHHYTAIPCILWSTIPEIMQASDKLRKRLDPRWRVAVADDSERCCAAMQIRDWDWGARVFIRYQETRLLYWRCPRKFKHGDLTCSRHTISRVMKYSQWELEDIKAFIRRRVHETDSRIRL